MRKFTISAGAVCCVVLSAMTGCVVDEGPNPNPNPASPDFLTYQYFPAGVDPLAVRVADLNGDGRRDMVVANNTANTVSVILASEETTFAAKVDLNAGTAPVSLVVADVTKDGKQDIVSVNSGAGSLSLFAGVGDGTFAAALPLGLLATAAPLDAVAADFDKDGDLDIATADSGTNTVSLLNNVNGVFDAAPAFLTVGSFPRSVLAADLNNDTFPDLVTCNRNTNNISLLLNNGAGGFAAAVNIGVGTNPRQARTVDVDKDNDPDLVVTNPGSKNITILLNNAAGVFTAGATIALDALPSRFATGDFDVDGNTDLAVLLFSTADANPSLGMVDVLYGNGIGGFPEALRYGIGTTTQDIEAADLNNDSRIDLIAADSGRDAATIAYGMAGGEFASDVRLAAGLQPREVVAVDLDKDNDLDLVAITQLDTSVVTLVNNGSGGFTLGNKVALTGAPRSLTVGLVNSDTIPDVAVTQITGADGVRVLFGKGDGTLLTTGATVALTGRDPRSVAIGDVNKDGKADLVTGDSNEDEISVALGDGAGVFSAPTHFACGNFPLNVSLTDTNADGKLDVVFLSRNDPDNPTDQAQPRTVRIFGKGDGTFDLTNIMRVATGTNPRDLVLGDISGDGLLDAVVASTGENTAHTHIIRADGTIVPGTPRRAGIGARAIALARVGTGLNTDILTINGDNSFSLIQNSGNNAFTLIASYQAGSDAIEAASGDFDKDGKVDLVLANRLTNDLSVVFGK